MIVVLIKPAGRPHVCVVEQSWAFGDDLAIQDQLDNPICSYRHDHTAMLFRKGDGKKPQPGSCINARRFLGI